MPTDAAIKPRARNVVEMLRAELAWYPGRPALAGRILLACTSVMLLAVIFRLPGAVLGASFPILISRESLKATRTTAFQIGLACSVATAEVIVGGVLTAGSPFLHVMWVVVSFFVAFYLISSLNFVSASLTFSAVLALDIRLWDYPISAEARVERTLYTLLSILIACAISVLIESLFSKRNLSDGVLDGISRRLSLVGEFLSETSSAGFPSSTTTIQLARSASRGVDELWQRLVTSRYEAGFRDLLATVIALTRQLTDLASTLQETAPVLSLDDQQRCGVIARKVALVRASLASTESPEWIDLAVSGRASNPILVEIERTTDLIAQSLCSDSFRIPWHASAPAPTVSIGEFIAGALQNTEHVRFAVRGALSALFCYLFYMCTGWTGLVSSTLTCMLTARRLTGGGRQRQTLRFAGFIVGAGVLGLGTEVFILPQLNTIGGFTLLFASAVWVGCWVATSGPRIAFAGLQIVLSYNLVTLNKFTLNTTLVPARDAVLGVVLGIVAMWLVFDHLWAQSSSGSVRNLLLVTLRNVANLKIIPAESPSETALRLVAESSRINGDFDKLRDLSEMYAFESFPKKHFESLVNRSIRTLLPELRAFLLVKTGLLQQRTVATARIKDEFVEQVAEQASVVLLGLASAIETNSTEALSSWSAHAQELRANVSVEMEKLKDRKDERRYTEMRLCASLMDLAFDLERRARLNFMSEAGVATARGNWSVDAIAN